MGRKIFRANCGGETRSHHYRKIRYETIDKPEKLIFMSLTRTVIGSFPRPLAFYSFEEAIKEVVDLQLDYGIDIITDGEQRSDMIGYFEQISGLERADRGLKIVGKIKPMDTPDDFYKIVDCRTVKSYLSSQGRDDIRVKITLTGPVTLGFSCAIGSLQYYRDIGDQRIYSDCSDAILPLAERALDLNCYLQIDEPGLSAGYASPKTSKDVLNRFISSLPDAAIDEERVSVHVCGSVKRIPKLYDALLALDARILSLAFSGERERQNIDVLSRKSLEDNQKKLGVGFISNTIVEDEKTALKRLMSIAQIIGLENIKHVHPDCGFAGTPRERVRPILENMKKATDTFMKQTKTVGS